FGSRSWERHRRTGKVKGLPVIVGHDLDHIKVYELVVVTGYGLGGCNDIDIIVGEHSLDRGLDRFWRYQRLVALYVYDDRSFGKASGNLCDAVASRTMLRRGQHRLVAGLADKSGDPLVIGRDYDVSYIPDFCCLFQGVQYQGLSIERKEHLSGQ